MRMLVVLVLAAPAVLGGAEEAPRGKLTSGTVTLFSQNKYEDYEKATFSFEHGIRDDPGLRRTHNDWDLAFGNDTFSVRMMTDDRSVIVDLGMRELADIAALPAFPAWKEHETTRAGAHLGHVYAVRTRDAGSDHVSLFRVTGLMPGDQCTIEWVHWQPASASAPELDLSPEVQGRLAKALDTAAQIPVEPQLRDPKDILLRICTGAQDGSRLALDGTTYRLPEEMDETDAAPRPRKDGNPKWSWRGGYVPKDRVLVVESIDLFAMGPGEGHGETSLRLPSGAIFEIRDEEGPFQVWFEGVELVRPGEEDRVVAEVANSSAFEARIRGRLVSDEEAARLERAPLQPTTAPEGVPRAGGRIAARRYLLEAPWLVLQVRSGAGGGNPNRVTMLGRGSIYLDAVSNMPVDLDAPLDPDADSVGYTNGGRIPRGKVFLVRKVTWRARAPGDSNGHGEALLRIGSQEIFHMRDAADEQRDMWTGAIEIRPGEETSIYLEVANSSLAEAWLEGEWK